MLLFTNGFAHRIPSAMDFGFLDGFIPFDSDVAIVEDGGEWRLRQRIGGGPPHDRGGRVDVDDPAKLWVGGRMRATSTSNSRYPCRILLVWIDDTRALQVVINNTTSSQNGVEPRSIGVFNGADEFASFTTSNLIATGPADMFELSEYFSWQAQFVRGEDTADGHIELYVDGVLAVDVDTDLLAEAEGAMTYLTFSTRGATTTNSASDVLYLDDLWVDDETNWGDAKVALQVPATQGNYTDGTLTGAGTKVEAVSNTPPDEAEYVTLGSQGDKESYEMSAAAEDRTGIAGLFVRPILSAGDPTDVFMRSGSTDEPLVTLESKGTSAEVYGKSVEVNPHTGQPFTFADLDGIEIGYEL